MSLSKKKKKDEESTSDNGVFFVAVFMALFGMLLGALYLSSFPALGFTGGKDLDSFIESIEGRSLRPGDVYYMEASTLRTGAWESKRKALLSGATGTVELTHAELNGWLAAKFRAPSPNSDDSSGVLIVPGVPNLYFDETTIYFNLPTEVIFFGSSIKYTVNARGHLSNDAQVEFIIDSIYFNSAGVPLASVSGKQVMNMFLKAYTSTEEFIEMQNAWARIESVEQAAGLIRIQMR
ncbi:MAG: hypothetical protein NWT02_02105 [Opitutales bacterium]|jgi:hypothetical protein|nr:hypothetical protein [Opitutales bacterium]MDP4643515.1 hypothetical protein [Opitutales bacterium]MDP4693233.1 hypothetical protein [Opitutales bacterium]MDP4778122.1 hypothetical protein [Opitutales bacterium]MDP4879487.1 hypothetical protein [Opitutales bacterium]